LEGGQVGADGLDAGLRGGSTHLQSLKSVVLSKNLDQTMPKNAFLKKLQKSPQGWGLRSQPSVDIRRLWAPPKIFRAVTHTHYCKLSQRTILALTRV